MASASSWILSAKVLFISAGILSIAAALKVSVPVVLDLSVSQAPLLWSSFRTWLKPPYLYVIINGIIITIAASSRFQQKTHQSEPTEEAPKSPADSNLEFQYTGEVRVEESEPEMVAIVEGFEERSSEAMECGNALVIASESTGSSPPRTFEYSPKVSPGNFLSPAEKPLVSSRFGHRRPVKIKSSPEGNIGGRALRVAKPKRQETMENTWKMITEGRAMPLTRHLKKSETLENQGSQMKVVSPARKLETFKDRTNNYEASPSPGSAGKMRREASLSQDELNRRVEAFINKFNNEMRMQRQASLNQYKEMINRASY